MKIFLYTRFCLPTYPTKIYNFRPKFKDEESYLKWLFNEERIEFRFQIFKQLTAPSIVNQTCKNFEWLILTSKNTPQKYIEYFLSINCKIIDAESWQEAAKKMEEHEKNNKDYVSIRLDDDDGLNFKYLEEIESNFEKLKNENFKAVFPKKGFVGYLDIDLNSMSYDLVNVKFPKSAGICAINSNVFNLGNHIYINKRYKSFAIEEKPLFIMSAGSHTIEKRKITAKFFSKIEKLIFH